MTVYYVPIALSVDVSVTLTGKEAFSTETEANVVKPILEVVDEIVGTGSRTPSVSKELEVEVEVGVEEELAVEGYCVMFTVNSYTGDDVIEVAEVAIEACVVGTSGFVVASFVIEVVVGSIVVASVVGAAVVVVVVVDAGVVDVMGGIVESNTHPSGGVIGDHPSVT